MSISCVFWKSRELIVNTYLFIFWHQTPKCISYNRNISIAQLRNQQKNTFSDEMQDPKNAIIILGLYTRKQSETSTE